MSNIILFPFHHLQYPSILSFSTEGVAGTYADVSSYSGQFTKEKEEWEEEEEEEEEEHEEAESSKAGGAKNKKKKKKKKAGRR